MIVGVNSNVIKGLAVSSASPVIIPIISSLLNLFTKPYLANKSSDVTSDELKVSIEEAVSKMVITAEGLFEVNKFTLEETNEEVDYYG